MAVPPPESAQPNAGGAQATGVGAADLAASFHALSTTSTPHPPLPPPPPPPPSDTRTQLMVSNLPFRVRWQDLKDLMRKAGVVLRTDVALTPQDGRSRGFGVVLFAKVEDSHKAIEMYNGWTWQNRVLNVQLDLIDPNGALAIAANQRQAAIQQQAHSYQLALMHHQQQMSPQPSWGSFGHPIPSYAPFPVLPPQVAPKSTTPSSQVSPVTSPILEPQTTPIRTVLEQSRSRSSPQPPNLLTPVLVPPPPPPPFFLDGTIPFFTAGGAASDAMSQISGSEPRSTNRDGNYEWYPNQQPPPSMFNPGNPPSMMYPNPNQGYQPFASMHGYALQPNSSLAPYYQPQRPGANMGPQTYPNRHIFVGNLPFNCQWQELKDLMRQAGSVIRADIAQGPEGRSRGFGSVLFTSSGDAERAVQLFNGYDYNGRALKVHFDKFSPPLPGAHPSHYPPPMSYFPHPQYPDSGPSRDHYSHYPHDFDDSSSSGPDTNPYSNVDHSESRGETISPPSGHNSSGGSEDPAATSSQNDTPRTSQTSPTSKGKNGAAGRPALKQIVLPPPYPFGGPFSPLTGRLPLMTPSMPAFNFGGYPTTPPVYPQFFSPGLGAFSPGLHSPHYGPSHFMNPAPGAPLHQQDSNSYPYKPHFAPIASSPVDGSSPLLPDTPGYFPSTAYSPSLPLQTVVNPSSPSSETQSTTPQTANPPSVSRDEIPGTDAEGIEQVENRTSVDAELSRALEEKLSVDDSVDAVAETQEPVVLEEEEVEVDGMGWADKEPPNGSRRKSFMTGVQDAPKLSSRAHDGAKNGRAGGRRASFEDLKRVKSKS